MTEYQKPAHMSQVVYDKLIQSGLNSSLIQEVIDICSSSTTEQDVRSRFDDVCENHKLEGSRANLDSDCVLGHVRGREDFIVTLNQWVPMTREELKLLFSAMSSDDPGQHQANIECFFSALENSREQIYISRGNPWFFVGEHETDQPFHTDLACLPARLAHPAYVLYGVESFYGLQLNLDQITEPHIPTIMDAQYKFAKELWEPDGLTAPKPHCRTCDGSMGFEEIVCRPALLTSIHRKIVEIETNP